jgi:hypothetical protein
MIMASLNSDTHSLELTPKQETYITRTIIPPRYTSTTMRRNQLDQNGLKVIKDMTTNPITPALSKKGWTNDGNSIKIPIFNIQLILKTWSF